MKKNFTGEDKLLHDLNQLAAHTNEGGYKTRAAYKSHMRNFIRFYWREYHGQKLSNIEGKHIRAYAEYMKAQGLSPTTIKSRLSGTGTSLLPKTVRTKFVKARSREAQR